MYVPLSEETKKYIETLLYGTINMTVIGAWTDLHSLGRRDNSVYMFSVTFWLVRQDPLGQTLSY